VASLTGRGSFTRPRSEWGVSSSGSVEPCSCAGWPGYGMAHSDGPFSQEWLSRPDEHSARRRTSSTTGGSCEFLSSFRQNATATGFAFHSTRVGLSTPRAAPCRDRRSLAAAPRRQPAPPTPRSPRARMCRCWDPSDRPACRAHHAEVLYDRMHGRIRRECPSHKVLRRLPRQCDGARRRPNSDAANRSLFAHTASVAAALGASALGASRSSKR
jgi:hypothetical protein